jgi:hypothetical protein
MPWWGIDKKKPSSASAGSMMGSWNESYERLVTNTMFTWIIFLLPYCNTLDLFPIFNNEPITVVDIPLKVMGFLLKQPDTPKIMHTHATLPTHMNTMPGIKIIMLLLLIAIGNPGLAQQVDENTARAIGRTFLSGQSGTQLRTADLQLVYTEGSKAIANSPSANQGKAYFYVFNAGTDDGFVMVSADESVTPILGVRRPWQLRP